MTGPALQVEALVAGYVKGVDILRGIDLDLEHRVLYPLPEILAGLAQRPQSFPTGCRCRVHVIGH